MSTPALKSKNDGTAKSIENYEQFSYFYDHGHRDFVNRANTSYDFVRGKQWRAADEAALTAHNKPALTINQMLPTYAVILGEFLKNRADVTFLPAKNGQDEVAEAMSKLWINTSNVNKLDWLELLVMDRGLVTGRGYFDIRVDFDKQMQGEIVLRAPRAQSVMLDPDIDSPFTKDWPQVIESRWMTLVDIESLFGDKMSEQIKYMSMDNMLGSESIIERPRRGDLAARANQDPSYTKQYRIVSRQHRLVRTGQWFVDIENGDMREVPDTWEDARIGDFLQRYPMINVTKRRYKDVRWTASIDHILLHDDWSPYDDFTIVPFFPFFLDGEPVSLFQQLQGSQELLNKTTSQELHILNTSSSSGWKFKTGTLVGMTREDLEARGADTGLVLEVAGDPDKDLVKITPNAVPTGHDRMSYKAGEHIKEISLVSDTMRGFDREDVSSKAIMAKTARGSVSLALPFSAINRSRAELAERAIGMYQSFYTEPRMVAITGGSAIEPTTEQFAINQPTPEGEIAVDLMLGEYSVVISPAPARSTQSESEFQELLQLQELGVPIPAEAFVEASQVSNKKRLLEAIRALSGGQEPAEVQAQQAEFERQMAEMEAAVAQADMALTQANANLANARAEKISSDAANVPNEQALKDRVQSAKEESERLRTLLDARKLAQKTDSERSQQAINIAKLQQDSVKHKDDTAVAMKAASVKKPAAGKAKPAAKKSTPTKKAKSK